MMYPLLPQDFILLFEFPPPQLLYFQIKEFPLERGFFRIEFPSSHPLAMDFPEPEQYACHTVRRQRGHLSDVYIEYIAPPVIGTKGFCST